MTTSKTRGLLAFIVLSCALAGCGAMENEGENPGTTVDTPTAAANVSASPDATPVPTAEIKKFDAAIYLTDADLLEMVENKVELSYENEEDLIKAAVTALQQDAGADAVSLWQPIVIHSVELKDGLVNLNIQVTEEARLGAPGEQLLIDTLQKTLFQFDFVKEIEILVDGEKVESLMGHVDLEHPMIKE
jgi:hypothetical protein